MAYLLALVSALLYGAGDFTGGLATRKAGTLPVVLFSQLAGLVLLALTIGFLPPASPSRSDIWWGIVAGVSGGTGVALLYRALATGIMAVVAPATAVCAVVIPVAAAVILGERPSLLVLAGIVLGVLSIVLVAQQPAAVPAEARRPTRIGLALLSGVAIGFFLLAFARTGTQAGMWPLLVARLVSVSLFVVVASLTRTSVRLPRGLWLLTLGCGVLDMSANAGYLVAARIGPLSPVVTLSSLYPASTVLLARLILHDRLNAVQAAGVGCALGAVALIVGG